MIYRVHYIDTIKTDLYDRLGDKIINIIDDEYRKHDIFGLGISNDDMDKIFKKITDSAVLKRLCEQAVREYVSEEGTEHIKPIKRRK